MMGILQYDFMRRAFGVGLMLALIVPCIGVIVVLRRLSMMGDALSPPPWPVWRRGCCWASIPLRGRWWCASCPR
jgi:hypothetical protein